MQLDQLLDLEADRTSMSLESKKAVPGWLILLCVLLVLGSLGRAATEITNVHRTYEPYFAEYPSLQRTVLIYQCVLFGSILAALYTVLLVYRRTPQSLSAIINGFLLTIGLRIIATWVFPLLADLPPGALSSSYPQRIVGSVVMFGIGTAWYLYLVRSKQVREVYAA
jgi:hypothetical protein